MADPRTTCEGKSRFETRDKAQKFAARIRKKGMAAQRAYHCKVCSGWHLTTKRTPVEIPAAPAPRQRGKRTAGALALELVDGSEQRFRFEDRVVVEVPAQTWDALAALGRSKHG